MQLQLSGSHRTTYDGIFREPVARDLGWGDMRSLLGALADVAEEPDGNLRITRRGQTLSLHPMYGRKVEEIELLMAIRHFLERSDAAPSKDEAEGTHPPVSAEYRQDGVNATEAHEPNPVIAQHADAAKFSPMHGI